MNTYLTYEEKLNEIKKERYLKMKKLRRIKQQRRQNFIKSIIILIVFVCSTLLMIDVARFPECYITTMKYQLKNDIESGNQEMIDYYNRVYVKNGRILFDNINY